MLLCLTILLIARISDRSREMHSNLQSPQIYIYTNLIGLVGKPDKLVLKVDRFPDPVPNPFPMAFQSLLHKSGDGVR